MDTVELEEYLHLTEPLVPHGGQILIAPGDFVLVRTLERVVLPVESKLAARIEGRSTLVRLGMTVHHTAPTIHAGFGGRIVLEICNHGIFTLRVTPNVTRLCQLIVEQVKSRPERGLRTKFLEQPTPLGSPSRKRARRERARR